MEDQMVVKENQQQALSNGDTKSAYVIRPTNFTELMSYADMLAKSSMVPKQFQGKKEDILIAIQMGAEVGLAAIQSLQCIAVINGRPSMWGDAVLALVQSSGKLEMIEETAYQDSKRGRVRKCVTKRKGYAAPHVTEFSESDAKAARLWSKEGPWTNYPDRMLQMRARAFNLRDQYADVLRGIAVREEVEDIVMVASESSTTSQPVYEPKPVALEKCFLERSIEGMDLLKFSPEEKDYTLNHFGDRHEDLYKDLTQIAKAKDRKKARADFIDKICGVISTLPAEADPANSPQSPVASDGELFS